MSQCLYCHERKGKRPCPALQGNICSPCCGAHRVVSINCPQDCVYLDANVEYQQKRMGERFHHERKGLYRELLEFGGEKAAEVFYLMEAVVYKHFHLNRNGQDGEVIAASQALRRPLSPIYVPEFAPPAFAEALKKEYTAFMEGQKIDPGLVGEVLDRGLRFINQFSGDGLRSNQFLSGLIGFFTTRHPQVANELTQLASSGGRIILPGTRPGQEDKPFLTP